MDKVEDLRRIALQEHRLQFPRFATKAAWELGLALKEMGEAAGAPLYIEIQTYAMPLFALTLPGAPPNNVEWARRKRNAVLRFHRSSYGMGRQLAHDGKTFADLGGLAEADFAVHGGGFPIFVEGTGCVGAAVVSGLPQREDHNMVVAAIAKVLGIDIDDIALD